MYRLFYSPGACSLAVHIVLEEIGAPFQLVQVSVQAGETSTPAYLAVNPKGRVPALENGGRVLTEVTAILTFLALEHPEGGLLPSNPTGVGRCLEWISWLASEAHPAFGQIWRPERSVEDPSQHACVQAKGRKNVLARLSEIEARLAASSGFAVADRYTIVDPYLLVYYQWARAVGVDMTAYPAWSSHYAAVSRRAAVERALSREGLRPAA